MLSHPCRDETAARMGCHVLEDSRVGRREPNSRLMLEVQTPHNKEPPLSENKGGKVTRHRETVEGPTSGLKAKKSGR